MGFLSNLARQIGNKDDDEAMDIIRRRAGMSLVPPPPNEPAVVPPPARRVVPMVGQPPPPAPGGIPTRNVPYVNTGEAPPAPDPYGLNDMEKIAADMRETMGQGDYSDASYGADGNLTGVRFPARAPAVPPPSRTSATVDGMPDPIATAPVVPRPMPHVMVGEKYEGMNQTQRAAARLRVLRDAAPESKVRDNGSGYEVSPPQRTGRLKAAGKGFLQLLAAGAPFGLGGMAGSGAVGAVQGLIDPGAVDKRGRQMEIAAGENSLARSQALDQQGLQNEARRIQNISNVVGLKNDALDRDLAVDKELHVEWQQGLNNIGDLQKRMDQLDPASPQYAAAETAIKQEAARLAKRTGRAVTVIPGNRKLNQLPRLQVDSQVVQQQHDGSWKAVFGSPKSNTDDDNADQKAEYEWQTKNTENDAKRNAAAQEASTYTATAEDHQRKVTQARNEVLRVEKLLAGKPPTLPGLGPNPEYVALKAQRDQAERIQNDEQRLMDTAYTQANEKKAEAAKYPTLPAPPKRVRRAATATGAGVQKLSKSAWEASHPGQDWNLAVQDANRRNIPIIP